LPIKDDIPRLDCPASKPGLFIGGLLLPSLAFTCDRFFTAPLRGIVAYRFIDSHAHLPVALHLMTKGEALLLPNVPGAPEQHSNSTNPTRSI
jgi:hypothetical protein